MARNLYTFLLGILLVSPSLFAHDSKSLKTGFMVANCHSKEVSMNIYQLTPNDNGYYRVGDSHGLISVFENGSLVLREEGRFFIHTQPTTLIANSDRSGVGGWPKIRVTVDYDPEFWESESSSSAEIRYLSPSRESGDIDNSESYYKKASLKCERRF